MLTVDELESAPVPPRQWPLLSIIDHDTPNRRGVRARRLSTKYVAFEVFRCNSANHGTTELHGHIRDDGVCHWKSAGDGQHVCFSEAREVGQLGRLMERAYEMAQELFES